MSHGKGIASSSHFTSKVSDAPHKDVLEKMQILLACEAACTNCADRAIEEGMTCWRDCRLCAAACSATAKFLSLNAPQAKEMIRIMVDCCSKCAEECEQHAKHGSVHCGDCAAACKKCVEAFKGETVKGSI